MFANSCSHVTAGGRLLDIDAINPITNKRIFDAGIENGVRKLRNYHIKSVCNPMVCVESREKGTTYQEDMSIFFKFICKTEKHGILYNSKTYYLKASFPADMSCHWKVTGIGGATKQQTLFCHCCSCQSADIGKYKVEESRCDICRRLNIKRCYCHNLETDRIFNMRQKNDT